MKYLKKPKHTTTIIYKAIDKDYIYYHQQVHNERSKSPAIM